MHDWQSLSHVRWECKYHVVIVPKYRKKKLYGKFRERVGQIIKDLCRQRGVEFIEGLVRRRVWEVVTVVRRRGGSQARLGVGCGARRGGLGFARHGRCVDQ